MRAEINQTHLREIKYLASIIWILLEALPLVGVSEQRQDNFKPQFQINRVAYPASDQSQSSQHELRSSHEYLPKSISRASNSMGIEIDYSCSGTLIAKVMIKSRFVISEESSSCLPCPAT